VGSCVQHVPTGLVINLLPPPPAHRQVDAIRIPVGGVGVAVTVLLNRSPRSEARSDSTSESRVVMSVNVMIGAVLILLMITLLSAFALEATAGSVGGSKLRLS
jgi:hypothetical protein